MLYATIRLNDPGQAEEVVQDTFYTAWRNYEKLRRHKAPEAYLMTTLKYKIKEFRRAQERDLNLFLSLDNDRKVRAMASGGSVPSSTGSLIELIKSNLSPEEWHILWRHVFKGASHVDLARELRITVWASQKRLERIRRKLRDILPDP